MRVVELLAVLLVAHLAPAAILTWPGPAPCDASLGNCISNANPSDIIRIASNAVDDGVTIINKSLTLEAAPGDLPRFAENERVIINFTDSADHSVTIRGLQFARGQIQAVHQGGDGTVLVERNRFETSINSQPSTWLSSSAENGDAIALWSFGGPIEARVVNNSMIGQHYGLAAREAPGDSTEATASTTTFQSVFFIPRDTGASPAWALPTFRSERTSNSTSKTRVRTLSSISHEVPTSLTKGVFNAHPVGMWYTDTHWAIFNQDLANMPGNAAATGPGDAS